MQMSSIKNNILQSHHCWSHHSADMEKREPPPTENQKNIVSDKRLTVPREHDLFMKCQIHISLITVIHMFPSDLVVVCLVWFLFRSEWEQTQLMSSW